MKSDAFNEDDSSYDTNYIFNIDFVNKDEDEDDPIAQMLSFRHEAGCGYQCDPDHYGRYVGCGYGFRWEDGCGDGDGKNFNYGHGCEGFQEQDIASVDLDDWIVWSATVTLQ